MAGAERPTLTGPGPTGHPADGAAGRDAVGGAVRETTRRAVEAVWRIESARIVGTLARQTGDFALAEDVAQEALAQALHQWPRDGVPREPAAWLLTVARRRAVDAFRRRRGLDERYAVLARGLSDGQATSGAVAQRLSADEESLLWDPDTIDDDVLALMFIACHPVLSAAARVALTLRVVSGLTSDEIARAFLVPVPTIQARITRAKKTLAVAEVPFSLPPRSERPQRLGAVLNALYVIFTEGSTASAGEQLLRPDLADEARRLARVLVRLLPGEAEVHGLLALMELTAARFPARTGPDGEVVLLDQQDRSHWDHAAIARGRAHLTRAATAGRGLGAYGLQAAIAACHAVAPSVERTDWDTIVVLYEALGRIAPSPVVELNRAVAVSMAHGPHAALAVVDEIAATGRLARSHLLPSVRGELLARLGRTAEARAQLEVAAGLCANERERDLLRHKAARLG